jgi:hypothetical protein
MAKYPVENSDADGIADGVNYVLSGPSGLGQYNAGFNSSTPAYITGNFRIPYSNPNFARTYVAPIALSTSEWLDDYTWKYTFATPEPVPPFALGNNITVDGVTPSDYDGFFGRIGVVFCDENYVIARAGSPYPNPGVVGTGGSVSLEVIYFDFPTTGDGTVISTDCNGIITIVGPEDFVNLSAQITKENAVGIYGRVVEPGSNGNFGFAVQLNRYKAFNNGTAANPQYLYDFDATVAERTQTLFLTGGVGQILTLSIDPSSGTKVSTTPSGFSAIIENFQTTTSGSGVKQSFFIDLPSSAAGAYTTANTDITISNPGYAFVVGDTITIPGSNLDGVDGVNDLVLLVDSVTLLPTDLIIDPTTTFTTVLDNPEPGLYWYIVEFAFQPQPFGSDVVWYVDSIDVGRRSLTAQIVKK